MMLAFPLTLLILNWSHMVFGLLLFKKQYCLLKCVWVLTISNQCWGFPFLVVKVQTSLQAKKEFTVHSSLACSPKNASNVVVISCISFPIIATGAHKTVLAYSNSWVRIWKERISFPALSIIWWYPWITSVAVDVTHCSASLSPAPPEDRAAVRSDLLHRSVIWVSFRPHRGEGWSLQLLAAHQSLLWLGQSRTGSL